MLSSRFIKDSIHNTFSESKSFYPTYPVFVDGKADFCDVFFVGEQSIIMFGNMFYTKKYIDS